MHNLDKFDLAILDELSRHGRLSNQELAERIGLSPSPCLRRVKALEDAGIIQGYKAILNREKMGLSLMALLHISLDKHTPERFEQFEQHITLLPEVRECLLITGHSADYQLKVVVKDMHAYQELLLHRITRIQGVSGVHTSFVLREYNQ